MNARVKMSEAVRRLAGITAALALVGGMAPPLNAAEIEAQAGSVFSSSSSTADGAMSPWVFWTTGDFRIQSAAHARAIGGPGTRDFGRWPQGVNLTLNKTNLGAQRPTLPRDPQGNLVSGDGPDYAASEATDAGKAGHCKAEAFGLGYIDRSWVDTYEFEVYAYGSSITRGTTFARAWIDDPEVFQWTDDQAHILTMSWTLNQGAQVQTDPNPSGRSRAGLLFESSIDLGNDGTFDQPFWTLSIEIRDGVPVLDLTLGDGVSLQGGATESLVEATLGSYYTASGGFYLPQDITIPFAFEVAASPAGGAVALDLNGGSYAEVMRTPDTANTLLMAAIGLGALGVVSRRRW